jgi:hypothetical protein
VKYRHAVVALPVLLGLFSAGARAQGEGGPSPPLSAATRILPNGATNFRQLGDLTAQLPDVRSYIAATGASCATNIAPALESAAALGVTRIFLPANCKYIPTANTTPANMTIVGGDWFTSIISSDDETNHDVFVGAHGQLENVGYQGAFCHTTVDPVGVKVCPFPGFINTGDTSTYLHTWPYERTTVLAAVSTPPGAALPSVDQAAFAVLQQSVGGDGLFCSIGAISPVVLAPGSTCYRIVPNGNGDYGLYILDGLQSVSSNWHYGIFAKEFQNNAAGATIKIDRVGDGADVGQSISMIDADSIGSTNTRPFLAESMSNQASGDINPVFQATTPFSGTVWHANMGNAGGTFTGKFAAYDIGGVPVYTVNGSGLVRALSGQLTGKQADAALPQGALAADENIIFSATADLVTKARYQLSVSTAAALPVRPTTDGTGTASAANCGNINVDNRKASVHAITLTATDVTTPAKGYSYYLPMGHLARFTGVGSTTWQGATPIEFDDGVTTGRLTAITADTAFACPKILWTPPTGNTDTWHVVVSFEMDFVR